MAARREAKTTHTQAGSCVPALMLGLDAAVKAAEDAATRTVEVQERKRRQAEEAAEREASRSVTTQINRMVTQLRFLPIKRSAVLALGLDLPTPPNALNVTLLLKHQPLESLLQVCPILISQAEDLAKEKAARLQAKRGLREQVGSGGEEGVEEEGVDEVTKEGGGEGRRGGRGCRCKEAAAVVGTKSTLVGMSKE